MDGVWGWVGPAKFKGNLREKTYFHVGHTDIYTSNGRTDIYTSNGRTDKVICTNSFTANS